MESCKCPITQEFFEDPVVGDDGHTYERTAITDWLQKKGTSPITRQPMDINTLRINYTVKQMVEEMRSTLQSPQAQYQFRLDIDIKKTRQKAMFQGFGKTIYEVEWINRDGPPIILLKFGGTKATREASFYVQLSCHPYIVRTFGFVQSNPDSVMLLQECAPHGDLSEFLQENGFQPNERVLWNIFEQICDAMICLADNGIVHGDLACRNVLVFQYHTTDPDKNLVKLTDFGLTRGSKLYSVVDSPAISTMTIIPVRYAAPEILRDPNKSNYSEKSDVYSMGVLMWEACSYGQLPYSSLTNDNDVRQRKLEDRRLPQPSLCSDELWTIISECWYLDPQNRIDFRSLKQSLLKLEYQSISKPGKQLEKQNYPKSSSARLQSTAARLNNSPSFPQLPETANQTQADSSQSPLPYYNHHPSMFEKRSLDIIECEFCQNRCDRSDYDKHKDNCLQNPLRLDKKRHRTSSTSDKARPSTNERGRSSDIVRIPCEFCDEQIDLHTWSIHIQNCRKKETRRLEARAEMINREPVTEKLPCEHCQELFPCEKLRTHEIVCRKNPECIDRAVRLPNTQSVTTVGLSNGSFKSKRDPVLSSTYSSLTSSSTSAYNLSPQSKDIVDRLDAQEHVPEDSARSRDNNALALTVSERHPLKQHRASDHFGSQLINSSRDVSAYDALTLLSNDRYSSDTQSLPHRILSASLERVLLDRQSGERR